MKKVLVLIGLIGTLLFPNNSFAIDLEAGSWRFNISGFLDLNYRYMGSMPMLMQVEEEDIGNGMGMANDNKFMPMPDSSSFDQRNLNLLLGGQKKKLRFLINLQANHIFNTSKNQGDFQTIEAYGNYFFSDLLNIRAGNMLAPFGIYNDSIYIASIFASSKLPLMYEFPGGHLEDLNKNNPAISTNLMPPNANLMIHGDYWGENTEFNYKLYLSNGLSDTHGDDTNKDKAIGGKIKITHNEAHKVGLSYYTVNNNSDTSQIGRESLMGIDLTMNLGNVTWESEYVLDHFDKRNDRLSYYSRLSLTKYQYTPFITLDYLEDKADALYKRGMNIYGTGLAYNVSQNTTLKGEYHYHTFNSKDEMPVIKNDLSKFHMVKFDIIFIF